jgi:hypothetical protein
MLAAGNKGQSRRAIERAIAQKQGRRCGSQRAGAANLSRERVVAGRWTEGVHIGTAKLSPAVYSDCHAVLCVLREAVHDDNRVEPSPCLPRARLGVLDGTSGLRRAPLGALREEGAAVHLPVV